MIENPEKYLIKGTFIFEGIKEITLKIIFNPRLVIEYVILKKIDNYPEIIPLLAISTYDFGLTVRTPVNPENNWLVSGYNGLTKESEMEDILMGSLIFDLFHALTHDSKNNNFTYYHWVLLGHLKNRATIIKNIDNL